MKKYALFAAITAVLSFTACNTAQKMYDAGNYDGVIQKLAPRAEARCLNNRNFNILANSYHSANQSDHERIMQLKMSGQPDVWSEVYQRYKSMKGRGDALSRMSNSDKQAMNFTKLDLDSELASSRSKAELYLAAKAKSLIESGDKSSLSEARKLLIQLQRTNPENTEIAALKQKIMVGLAETALLTFENNSRNRLTASFVNELMKPSADVPKLSVEEQRNVDYDLIINIRLDDIDATPERTDAVTFTESQGGVEAQVIDKTDSKSLTIKGMVEYYGNNGKILRLATPFEVTSTFKHDYSEVKGSLEACSQHTIDMVKAGRIPFPTDESLVVDAAAKLNSLLMEQLR